VNHKRVDRAYKAAALQVRRRRRRRLTRAERTPLVAPSRPGERWSMDFTSDTLRDGRVFRTIVDDFTRECVAIEVDRSLPGLLVARALPRRHAAVGFPRPSWRRRAGFCGPHGSLDGVTPEQFARLLRWLAGSRRLALSRTKNPRTSHYPCSGFWGRSEALPPAGDRSHEATTAMHYASEAFQRVEARVSAVLGGGSEGGAAVAAVTRAGPSVAKARVAVAAPGPRHRHRWIAIKGAGRLVPAFLPEGADTYRRES
jgi:putative transposase